MACIELQLKHRELATCDFQTHPLQPAKAEPSFRKVSLPIVKQHILFPAYLYFRQFWSQIFSLWQVLDWGLLPKIPASTKMGDLEA